MANRTDKSAYALHGKDPQLLVEKILRNKVYESLYWKEKCFGLNEEGILDEAVVAISEYGGPAAPNNAKGACAGLGATRRLCAMADPVQEHASASAPVWEEQRRPQARAALRRRQRADRHLPAPVRSLCLHSHSIPLPPAENAGDPAEARHSTRAY